HQGAHQNALAGQLDFGLHVGLLGNAVFFGGLHEDLAVDHFLLDLFAQLRRVGGALADQQFHELIQALLRNGLAIDGGGVLRKGRYGDRASRGKHHDAVHGFPLGVGLGGLGIERKRMDGVGDQITQKIIHQAMARNGRQTGEPGRHNMHVVMARAALRAGVSGMQVRVVADVEREGVERSQAGAYEVDAFVGYRHGKMRRDGQSWPASEPLPGWRGCCMWRPSQSDWPMTKTSSSPISPKTLKLTHWDSVKWPENATYRLMAPAARKNSAQLRLSFSHAGAGSSICLPSSRCIRLRPNSRRAPSKAPPNSQYSTVGFHLMKTSLCSHSVAPPKMTMTDRLIQCVASICLPVARSQMTCARAVARAPAVAAEMSASRYAMKNRISGNRSNRNFFIQSRAVRI